MALWSLGWFGEVSGRQKASPASAGVPSACFGNRLRAAWASSSRYGLAFSRFSVHHCGRPAETVKNRRAWGMCLSPWVSTANDVEWVQRITRINELYSDISAEWVQRMTWSEYSELRALSTANYADKRIVQRHKRGVSTANDVEWVQRITRLEYSELRG